MMGCWVVLYVKENKEVMSVDFYSIVRKILVTLMLTPIVIMSSL